MRKTQVKGFAPNYSGSDVPDDEQELCESFAYNSSKSYHCLKSIYISGNYLVVLGNEEYYQYQRFPISVNLVPALKEKYGGYNRFNGPIDLTLDWYYTSGNKEDWLWIIPLAAPVD